MTSHLAVLVTGLTLALVVAQTARAAEAWPQRAVRVIVPFGAGSGPDVAARLYADRLAARWQRPVLIENRLGAEGMVGVSAFAGVRDDHVLLFSPAAPISVFPFTHQKLSYDPARDLLPISLAVDTFGSIAVSASLKVTSLAELVALARSQPGKLNWTSGGGAFPTLLSGFAKTSGLDLVQVTYREQNVAIHDLAEGRVQILGTTITPLLPLARAGKVRLLAVTNKRRAPIAPDIPTAAETGYPELEFEGMVGFFGGRDMPLALRDRISADMRAVAADPALSERLAAAGQVVRSSTPAEFADALEEQRAKIGSIVQRIKERQ